MATLVFFNRRTIEVTINLQTIVQCTIAMWGSFCNVTADPCATCGGSRYHACEKGLIAGCGSGRPMVVLPKPERCERVDADEHSLGFPSS